MIVFIADEFSDNYIGGAELSIQAHIDTCPHKYRKIKSSELRLKDIRDDDFLIFGNFFKLNRELLSQLSGYPYVVEECDYKYCVYRSSHLHSLMKGKCDCPQGYSKPVIDFFLGAKHIFWKSEKQRAEYIRLFPELKDKPSDTMGGVYTDAQLDFIVSLKDAPQEDKYYILKSGSWIKGYREALGYCIKNGLRYTEISGLPFEDSLREMARCKGIVYLPNGYDVSCRMITEMKLLGREIITNNNVQHMTEDWFNSGEEGMLEFLRSRNKIFWERVNGLRA